jgi:hypothetical protein
MVAGRLEGTCGASCGADGVLGVKLKEQAPEQRERRSSEEARVTMHFHTGERYI